MIRKEVIQTLSKFIKNDIIVSANGYISRDLFTYYEKKTNFYMIGSMGLASSIGLGIALVKPKKRIFVLDGDGNILMNLNSLVTIASLKPKNIVHIILDNHIHESTGGQPTFSKKNEIVDIAKSLGYKSFSVNSKKSLIDILKKIQHYSGPVILVVKISIGNYKSSRINIKPEEIKNRFMNAIKN